MQNTRLSTLIEQFSDRFAVFLRNPWRRLSLLIISLLGGNFLATILSTVAGQNADLDIAAALVLVAIAELISWLIYGNNRRRSPAETQRLLLLEILNGTKLGLTYGLFVEAFKLGS
jgi:hypothetical protein